MSAAAVKVDGNNSTSSPVEDRYARARLRLNPRRQRLLQAILEAADETCFLSSRELAKRYNVDATTILRTTQVLGYKSFADFSTDLRQHFVARITPYAALKAATREKRSVADHIDHALDKALENLKVLDSDLDRQRLIELAKVIKRSRRVLVVGLDFAASLARVALDAGWYLSFSGIVTYKTAQPLRDALLDLADAVLRPLRDVEDDLQHHVADERAGVPLHHPPGDPQRLAAGDVEHHLQRRREIANNVLRRLVVGHGAEVLRGLVSQVLGIPG